MRVRLTRRLGQNPEGTVIERGDSEAHWLMNQGHATPEPGQPHHEVHEVHKDTADNAAPTLKELQAQAAGLELKTYGTKQQVAARIAAHLAHVHDTP